MGKKKKGGSGKSQVAAPESAPSDKLSRYVDVPQDVLGVLGTPVAAVLLIDGRVPECSRVLLSTETMHRASLNTGVTVGIALGDCPIQELPTKAKSGFAPAFDLEDVGGFVPVRISEKLTAASSQKTADFLLVGEAWPGVKLQKGTIQLSGALLARMGYPQAGSTVLIYKLDFMESSVACSLSISLAAPWTGEGGDNHSLVASERPGTGSSISVVNLTSSGGPVQLEDQEGNGKGLQAKQMQWLQNALASPVGRQTQILSELVLRQLNGQWLLQHSYIPITVLGCTVLFKVDDVVGDSVSDDLMHFHVVGGQTKISFLASFSATDSAGRGKEKGQFEINNAEASFLESVRESALDNLEGSSRDVGAEAAVRSAKNGLNSIRRIVRKKLGGLLEYQKSLQSLVVLPLKHPGVFHAYGLKPPRGVIFHGPPGTGKTFLACTAALMAEARFFVVNGPDVMCEFYGGSEASLSAVFRAAETCSPSVIFLDEIDALMPAREHSQGGFSTSAATSTSSRLVTALLTLMDGMKTANNSAKQVVVIAATNRLDAIDPALRRPGRFDQEIAVGVPSPVARKEILKAQLQNMHHDLTVKQVEELASSAHGFVTADLSALCQEAAMVALRRLVHDKEGARVVGAEDFQAAQTRIRPSAMREISVQVPAVRWEDVGGLGHVKQQLKEAVEWPIKHAESLARIGAKPPGGVLLYGPPGCSKTMLAKAIATETKMNFLSVKGSELLSTYVGESEKAVTMLFSQARQLAPCIVFFDELDGLVGTRGEDIDGGTGVGERVITQLLIEVDGVRDRGLVVVIGATNKPQAIDSALLRPGRFDRLVYVPPPTPEGREAIFKIGLRNMPTEPELELSQLVQRSEGYTGADIAAVCREAGLVALDEDIGASVVAFRHLLKALDTVPRSIPLSWQESAQYMNFQRAI